MRVVLYMRYSSANQSEQSIEGQERVCKEYCRKNQLTIVDEYIDRATSAFKDTDKRFAFQRMMEDSAKNRFEGVVVYKLDRFARNRYDSATYKARLKKNGVKVISATENIGDNPESVILESVLEGMAEFYSLELAQKIHRGQKESALKGKYVGGRIPLGYKIVDGKYAIDPITAPIVKEAFREYANGMNITELCERFNKKGYRTSKGAEFNKNSFKIMFKNEKYIGTYRYQDVCIENGIPSIVSKPLFEKVQDMIKTNKYAPAKATAKVRYLLSGKIFCGECGDRMNGESGYSKSGRLYHYYTCSGRKTHTGCVKKPIKKEWIEDIVFHNVMEIFTQDVVEKLADAAVKACEQEILNNSNIPDINQQIKDTEKKMMNIITLVENGADSSLVVGRLNDLEKLKKDLQIRLMDAQKNIVTLTKEEITDWLRQFINGDVDDPSFKQTVFDLLVNSVTVYDSPDDDSEYKIRIAYNLEQTLHPKEISGSTMTPLSPYLSADTNTLHFYSGVLVTTLKAYA